MQAFLNKIDVPLHAAQQDLVKRGIKYLTKPIPEIIRI